MHEHSRPHADEVRTQNSVCYITATQKQPSKYILILTPKKHSRGTENLASIKTLIWNQASEDGFYVFLLPSQWFISKVFLITNDPSAKLCSQLHYLCHECHELLQNHNLPFAASHNYLLIVAYSLTNPERKRIEKPSKNNNEAGVKKPLMFPWDSAKAFEYMHNYAPNS